MHANTLVRFKLASLFRVSNTPPESRPLIGKPCAGNWPQRLLDDLSRIQRVRAVSAYTYVRTKPAELRRFSAQKVQRLKTWNMSGGATMKRTAAKGSIIPLSQVSRSSGDRSRVHQRASRPIFLAEPIPPMRWQPGMAEKRRFRFDAIPNSEHHRPRTRGEQVKQGSRIGAVGFLAQGALDQN
jgi:hypothetical protein